MTMQHRLIVHRCDLHSVTTWTREASSLPDVKGQRSWLSICLSFSNGQRYCYIMTGAYLAFSFSNSNGTSSAHPPLDLEPP